MSPFADVMHTRESMIARGAYGYLGKALERYIPLDRVVVLTPLPACAAWGTYATAGAQAIEVKYARDEGVYLAFNAAAVVEDARRRGDTHIRAFVEPDGNDVGAAALLRPPGQM